MASTLLPARGMGEASAPCTREAAALLFTVLDVGIEHEPLTTAVRVTLDVFGSEAHGRAWHDVADEGGVLALNERLEFDVAPGSPLAKAIVRALGSEEDEAADVFLIVSSPDDAARAGAEDTWEELGVAHLDLREVMWAETDEIDRTLELYARDGGIVGAVSVTIAAAPALRTLVAAHRQALRPPTLLGEAAGDAETMRIGVGDVALYPHISRQASTLPRQGDVFVALELAATQLPPGVAESPSVRLAGGLASTVARLSSTVSLSLAASSLHRRALALALRADSAEEDSDLFLLLLQETDAGARELGSAYVNLRQLLRAGAEDGDANEGEGEATTLPLMDAAGSHIGAASVDLTGALACLRAVAAPSFRGIATRREDPRVPSNEQHAAASPAASSTRSEERRCADPAGVGVELAEPNPRAPPPAPRPAPPSPPAAPPAHPPSSASSPTSSAGSCGGGGGGGEGDGGGISSGGGSGRKGTRNVAALGRARASAKTSPQATPDASPLASESPLKPHPQSVEERRSYFSLRRDTLRKMFPPSGGGQVAPSPDSPSTEVAPHRDAGFALPPSQGSAACAGATTKSSRRAVHAQLHRNLAAELSSALGWVGGSGKTIAIVPS